MRFGSPPKISRIAADCLSLLYGYNSEDGGILRIRSYSVGSTHDKAIPVYGRSCERPRSPQTWEMYLACLLLERGYELRKTRPKGPDLRIEGESPMWIEVIAVESVVSEDRVKTQEERRDTNASQIEGIWIGELLRLNV